MTIKIIKRGVHPDEKVYHGVCRRCKTEIEFLAKDGKYMPAYEQRDGPTIIVECPVCKHSITVAY